MAMLYKEERGKKKLDVRNEGWYMRYWMSNETTIRNIHRKYPDATVKLVGIQGCLTHGLRTR